MKTPKGISKCRAPGFSDSGSKKWKTFKILLNGDNEVEGHYESSKGRYFYFLWNNEWRCGKLADFANPGDETVEFIDLRFTPKEARLNKKEDGVKSDPRQVWIGMARQPDEETPQVAAGNTSEACMISLAEYIYPDNDDPIDALDKAIEKGSIHVEVWQEEVRF